MPAGGCAPLAVSSIGHMGPGVHVDQEGRHEHLPRFKIQRGRSFPGTLCKGIPQSEINSEAAGLRKSTDVSGGVNSPLDVGKPLTGQGAEGHILGEGALCDVHRFFSHGCRGSAVGQNSSRCLPFLLDSVLGLRVVHSAPCILCRLLRRLLKS